MKTYRFARSYSFNRHFEHFFLAAIVSVIVIRLYLHITGYPQIGGGELHIAHMLWGGLLMMFALLGNLLFLNNDLKHTWAILGGAGFGTFIDEIGKFITQDNNYFYQPTFAIMYAIFVALYLLYRNLWYRQNFSKEEYLLNSVDELKEIITKELDTEEVTRALYFLSLSDQKNPLTKFLQKSFKAISETDQLPPSLYYLLRQRLSTYYHGLIIQPWFLKGVVTLLLLRAGIYFFEGSMWLVYFATQPPDVFLERLANLRGILPLINVIANITQASLTVFGAILIWRSRVWAYHLFRNALLVSILILQLFNFYHQPVLALLTTARDVILLALVEYMITKENTRTRASKVKKYLEK